MQATRNKVIPNPNLPLSFSNDPDIINTNPKNPHIAGRICENIVVPKNAILNHYYNLHFLII